MFGKTRETEKGRHTDWMRLENVLALTHGELVSTPFVSSFTTVTLDAKSVKRGDLFMAFDEEGIEEAILNGAYGIVFCKPTQISDSEIAWIKVANLEDALARLLRFKLIDTNSQIYETNDIVIELALQIMTESSFVVVSSSIKENFHKLWHLDAASVILYSPTLTDSNIFAKSIKLNNSHHEKIDIVEQTLFETSFIFDNTFYERQLISPFFMPYLETLLNLFKNLKINYRLKKFTPIEHFEAVFTNKKLEPKEFGTSDKVLIFEKNISLIEEEILFLQREATWAKIVYTLPSSHRHLGEMIADKESLIFYNYKDEIISLLNKSHFHFALIVGVDKSIVNRPIANQTTISLFDFH